ncbi:type IV secretory system conjugative DNA transfer family protein [Streptomyces olivaceiscleroticus]|uniref:FtsK domain-containing protein n=1 Tax=Streptomyces olivaceiscleroticus TaxID=68245 RepID=A0ABN1BMW3_9ACTN
MTSPVTAPRTAKTGVAAERAVALATTFAPVATGFGVPWLDASAKFLAALGYAGTAGFLAANAMNRLPDSLVHNLPGEDIIRAHRATLALSTATTGVALAMGSLTGPEGSDLLMSSVLNVPAQPVPGIISLGWWAAVFLTPIKLRRVFSRKAARPAATAKTAPAKPQLPPEVVNIRDLWGEHISHPRHGRHKGEELTVRTYGPHRWTGTITARSGQPVTVTKETVSSVYKRDTSLITFKAGAHSGERHIIVNHIAPPELNTNTLIGAWMKYAARTGGVMSGTHLEQAQPDPNTGGEVAWVVADEHTDVLPTPKMRDLVGALRTSHLLLSYEPSPNPRRAKVRLMKENPLKAGVPLTDPRVLLPSKNGYFRIGTTVSGRPARAQLLDPKIGARHLLISGITGSGKGGVLQLIALAAHLSGAVIIYADPKGSSNPAIEAMAAYSGLGVDGAMRSLLLMEAIHQHRTDLTAKLKQKNFDPSAMPHVVFIGDEMPALTGTKAKYRDRATGIVAQTTKEGRSLGESMVLATQLMQLKELGGDAAIRDNINGNGGTIMLRADSSQRHLIDLPPGMESVNPADIPATWSGEENDVLVYNDDVVMHDPESTFGLGYFMTTDGICAMARSLTLEDATPHVDPDRVATPYDWADWDRREEIIDAAFAALESGGTSSYAPASSSTATGAIDMVKKDPTADDKILAVLRERVDPAGIDIIYTHRDLIRDLAKVEGRTLDNAFTRLTKAGEIHRQIKDGREVPGMYGLGRAPQQDEDDEAADE